MREGSQQHSDTEVVVTSEMVKAGVEEIREHDFGEPLEAIVEAVYLQMRLEELSRATSKED